MFHEVRIFNPEGKIKKVVSGDQLSRMFWQQFRDAEDKVSLVTTGRAKVPTWVKQRLDQEYPEFFDFNLS